VSLRPGALPTRVARKSWGPWEGWCWIRRHRDESPSLPCRHSDLKTWQHNLITVITTVRLNAVLLRSNLILKLYRYSNWLNSLKHLGSYSQDFIFLVPCEYQNCLSLPWQVYVTLWLNGRVIGPICKLRRK
jgi:hypothetical protein